MSHVPSLRALIEQFRALPGIGPKLAIKLAYYIVESDDASVARFVAALQTAKSSVKLCQQCCNFTDSDSCSICSNVYRDQTVLCVVEQPRDVASIERTKEFKGLYHVLHGALSPLAGITPADIKLTELLGRLKVLPITEVIMATNPTVEGEATAMYVARLLKPLGINVSRLAHGLPVGGDIELADEVTLSKALENRKIME